MTEGEKAINIKLSLSLLPSRLRRATYCPLAVSRFCAAWSAAQNRPLRQQMLPLSATGGGRICCPSEEGFILRAFSFDEPRRGELCSPVFICYELTGDRRSPLRVDIEFNLISPESSSVFVNYHGGSKPPPYTIGYIIQFVLPPHL